LALLKLENGGTLLFGLYTWLEPGALLPWELPAGIYALEPPLELVAPFKLIFSLDFDGTATGDFPPLTDNEAAFPFAANPDRGLPFIILPGALVGVASNLGRVFKSTSSLMSSALTASNLTLHRALC
jgi:hypothetical protein